MKKSKIIFGLALTFLLTGCVFKLPDIFPTSSSSSGESDSSQSKSSSSKESSSSTGSQTSTSTSSAESTTSGSSTSTSSSESSSSGHSSSSSSSQSSSSSSSSTSIDPSGDTYYAGISDSLSGESLKSALFNLIKITTAGWSYDGLWTAYQTSDRRSDGTVWDIYSDKTKYKFGKSSAGGNQCGTYGEEGDCYNREHVIPQGSFNEAAPMKSDIHHVLPSDGYVNNRRGSYAHAEVSSATYTSNDGCKLGSPKVSGAPSPVFEPMNHYKGDIARIYFYFVTCYQDKMSNNSFVAFNQTTFPSIKPVLLPTYLKWHLEDAVSEKETIRNNVAYSGQGNRNPFIDHPEYACKIWGDVNDDTRALCGM